MPGEFAALWQGVCKLIEFAAGGGFTLAQCQQDDKLGDGGVAREREGLVTRASNCSKME